MTDTLGYPVICDICGQKFDGLTGEDLRIFYDEHPSTHPEWKEWERYFASDGQHLRPVRTPKKLETHYPEKATGYCYNCEAERHWGITHGFVNYHGLVHILKCEVCGVEVPYFAFHQYQSDGRVIIPV